MKKNHNDISKGIKLGILSTFVSLALSFSSQAYAVESLNVFVEKTNNLALYQACKIVRNKEPKGDLTFTLVSSHKTLKRPIYSDICLHPTAQWVNRIFSKINNSGTDLIIIGFMPNNDGDDSYGDTMFSGFVMK